MSDDNGEAPVDADNTNTAGKNHATLRSREELLQLLEEALPLEQVVYAFGYGSGVLSQTAETSNSTADNTVINNANMIDVIVAVRDAHAFHEANVRRNPDHYYSSNTYSIMRHLLSPKATASVAACVQRHSLRLSDNNSNTWLRNPGLYFHVNNDHTMKYGVVQVDDLEQDLTDWTYLYAAGRLHKPVVTIISDNTNTDSMGKLHAAQHEKNLPAALSAALLLDWNDTEQRQQEIDSTTNTTATTTDVYARIAGISYTGDPRMALNAEDPNKVANLVFGSGQLQRFDALYKEAADALQREGILTVSSSTNSSNNYHATWSWDATNPLAHTRLWQSLPYSVRSSCCLTATNNADTNSITIGADAAEAARRLPAVLASIVAPAARYQTIKGVWTAGLGKSAVYAYRKLSKGLLLKKWR